MLILKRYIKFKYLVSGFAALLTVLSITSCGDQAFLDDAINANKFLIESGDIIIVSGGNVPSSSSPYPIHQISIFSKEGIFKGILHKEPAPGYLMGATLNFSKTGLLFTVDNIDRVDEINFLDQGTPTNYILDSNLAGSTMRSVAVLSDGGTLIAESTGSIEKYDNVGNRVTTNFPIAVSANLMKIRAISGNRFALVYTGGNDRISIRNNIGTVVTSINSGLACGTNCNPSDIVELPDGRFVVTYQAGANLGLQLYSSSFVRIGALFEDKSILQGVSALAVMNNGNILACSTLFNICEQFLISGNMATRVGSVAFLSDVGKIRQPTDIVIVP